MSCRSRIGTLAVCLVLSTGGHAGSLSEKELQEQLASFGDDFVIERLEAPTIENPHDWINRPNRHLTPVRLVGSPKGILVPEWSLRS